MCAIVWIRSDDLQGQVLTIQQNKLSVSKA
jgi:hypothetical protein